MEISIKLKERFCKDCNIPIKLFQEPYFRERLRLYDPFFGTLEKYGRFLRELEKYDTEQDYFEDYNRVKDEAISFIKGTDGFKRFNEEDMNQFAVQNTGFTAKDIYKPSNVGKWFISIDMKKANFSALSSYSPDIFDHCATWEDFIGKFTENEHIMHSKYIRQVILGNCNPKRQITYEKYLMDHFLSKLRGCVSDEKIVSFANDEIVIDVTDLDSGEVLRLLAECDNKIIESPIPLRRGIFILAKIAGTDGYVKQFRRNMEFKCIDSYMYPFVLREVLQQEITESDKVFYHEGLLAKFIDTPEISIGGLNAYYSYGCGFHS